MRKLSKRTKVFQDKVDAEKLYPLTEAIDLLKEVKTTKFDETVDVALRLGVDTRKAEQIVRGTCSMPNGLGKKIRVLVFAKADKAIAAEEAGANYIAFGRFYPSKTKPEAPKAHIHILREAQAMLSVPIVAIGGINAENGAALITAGADMLAVVHSVFGTSEISANTKRLVDLFRP